MELGLHRLQLEKNLFLIISSRYSTYSVKFLEPKKSELTEVLFYKPQMHADLRGYYTTPKGR